MKNFMKIVNDVSNSVEELANLIENDETTREALSAENAEVAELIKDGSYVYAVWVYLENFLF